MTVTQLNTYLTKALKSYIKKKGFVSSGKLLKSVKFNNSFDAETMKLEINLDAEEYILYLEKGNFLQNFLDTKRAQSLIEDFMGDQLEQDFEDGFDEGL